VFVFAHGLVSLAQSPSAVTCAYRPLEHSGAAGAGDLPAAAPAFGAPFQVLGSLLYVVPFALLIAPLLRAFRLVAAPAHRQ